MKQLLTAVVFAVVATASAPSLAAISNAGGESVRFTAKATLGIKIVGTSTKLKATEQDSNIVITVPLAAISTGIDLRDEHMRQALETSAYPDAELKVARSAISLEGSGDASGTLKLHGVSKAVKFHYENSRDGDTFNVKGSFSINMTHFGITPPSKMGASVKPDVVVAVAFKAKDN